jgi:Protein of unknown function (DUF3558)
MTPRGIVVTLTLAVAVLAGGCMTGADTTPPSPRPSPTPTTGTTPTDGATSAAPRPTVAPPVTRTLDIGPYRPRPCDLLTADQQAALDLPRTHDVGGCTWEKAQPKTKLNVDILADINYFAQVYRESNDEDPPGSGDKEWKVFEPVTIAGQPALVLNPASDRGFASVLVATSPDDSIYVGMTADAPTADPRAMAMTIAEQILSNLIN